MSKLAILALFPVQRVSPLVYWAWTNTCVIPILLFTIKSIHIQIWFTIPFVDLYKMASYDFSSKSSEGLHPITEKLCIWSIKEKKVLHLIWVEFGVVMIWSCWNICKTYGLRKLVSFVSDNSSPKSCLHKNFRIWDFSFL